MKVMCSEGDKKTKIKAYHVLNMKKDKDQIKITAEQHFSNAPNINRGLCH
jgi:hypothetical protein